MKYFVALLAAIAVNMAFAFGAAIMGWRGGVVFYFFLFVATVLVWGLVVAVFPDAKKKTTSAWRQSRTEVDIDDAPLYEKALLELESETRDDALWAKAISLTDGDENKAKARYIKLRVEALVQEERARLDQKREERQKVYNQLPATEKRKLVQQEFNAQFPVGKKMPVLYKHFGNRIARMSSESDRSYAKRLEKFVRTYEKETGLCI